MAIALKRTSSGIVKAIPIKITGVVLVAGDSADATVTLYDNASAASGTTILELSAPTNETRHIDFIENLSVKNGVYAEITGTGAKVYVYEA